MSHRVAIVRAIVVKDVRAFFRDRFYVVVTLLGLVAYVAIFWVLPDTVDETLELGVHAPGLESFFGQLEGQNPEGLAVVSYSSSDDLRTAVQQGSDVMAGIDFPPDFLQRVASGSPSTVTVFLGSDVPDSVRTVITGMVKEMAYLAAGEEPPVTLPAEQAVVLGPDRAGDQVSLREQMAPMLVFFVLLIEMMALATLVASEIATRTATAVLVTPARVSDLLVAKGMFGTILAFAEALLLMIAIGRFGANPLTLTVILLLGAVLVTGFGLLAGSSGADFLGIVFWSMAFMIPMAIPAFGLLFPGSAAGWVKALPSWGLVEGILQGVSYGASLSELGTPLVALAGWCVVAFVAGWIVLKRRVVRL